MGILHEQDNHMKRLKVQAMTMRKYAVARMIRFSAKRNKFRMRCVFINFTILIIFCFILLKIIYFFVESGYRKHSMLSLIMQ